ncbi:MAG TPA: DUF4091 domain-containing protein [Patescibacteria group bacterium]|nr:DUF4091 domain-containing protein [Patescibacteria group bacterium]
MKRLACALLFIMVLVNVPAAAPAEANTWFVDSLVKVFPGDLPGTHRLAGPEFAAARNQHVSIQLALRSARPLPDVSAEITPLEGSPGPRISSGVVHAVGYVVVGSHTKNTPVEERIGEAPGWFPDPLWDLPMALEPNRTRSLWATIAVPADAAPGLYRGAVVLRTGKRLLARKEFRVRVYAATVPERRSLKVTNWVNLGDKTSRQFYGFPQFSEDWWTWVANFAVVLADHRQNVIYTPLLDLIPARADGDRLAYDFDNFDRWVETFRQAGVIGTIEGSHLLDRDGSYDAPLIVRTRQLVDGRVVEMRLPPDDPRVETFLTDFLVALDAHLGLKGWKPIYLQHILDEPHGAEPPYYARFGELVRRVLPGVSTMDAMDAATMSAELKKYCDVWVPQLGQFDDQMELIGSRIRGGSEVWFYTCLFPTQRYLNRLIDYPLLKVRLLHWLNFRYDLAGYLHWGGNYWTPEPVNDTQPVIDANTELLPAGDAFIVYPDAERKSVFSSIRLEAMREGIEDYELLRQLKERSPGEAERLARAAIGSFTEYVRDPAAFRRIQKSLLEALSGHQ